MLELNGLDDFIMVYRNYKRYDHLNLSIKTAKKFISEDNIFCLDLCDDINNDANLNKISLPSSNIIVRSSKYKYDKTTRNIYIKNNVPDNWLSLKHYEKTSNHYEPYDYTYCHTHDLPNSINTLFFSEGYNIIFDLFKNYSGKLFCLNEDQFFTTGQTIQDLKQNDFDLAWANWCWPTEKSVNGSILCYVPKKCMTLFPLPEIPVFVDSCYYEFIVTRQKQHNLKLYKMKFREGENYFGDGIRTNSYEDMIRFVSTNFPNVLN